jgi:hypothetical protein
MMVRVVVRLMEPASMKYLVHATRYEPVFVDDGIMAFDVPYRRVEAVLNQLVKAGAGEFLAHLCRSTKNE